MGIGVGDPWAGFYDQFRNPDGTPRYSSAPARVTGEGLNVYNRPSVPINPSTGMPYPAPAQGGLFSTTPLVLQTLQARDRVQGKDVTDSYSLDERLPAGVPDEGSMPPLSQASDPRWAAEDRPAQAPYRGWTVPKSGDGDIFSALGDLWNNGTEQVGNAYTAATGAVNNAVGAAGKVAGDAKTAVVDTVQKYAPLLRLQAMFKPYTGGTLEQRLTGTTGHLDGSNPQVTSALINRGSNNVSAPPVDASMPTASSPQQQYEMANAGAYRDPSKYSVPAGTQLSTNGYVYKSNSDGSYTRVGAAR